MGLVRDGFSRPSHAAASTVGPLFIRVVGFLLVLMRVCVIEFVVIYFVHIVFEIFQFEYYIRVRLPVLRNTVSTNL